jgi:hypothetical protein
MENIDLTLLTNEELIGLKNRIEDHLHSQEDGYFYICIIHSWGSVYTRKLRNLYSVNELCYEYGGDNGIVNVYSNNPNLDKLENYAGSEYFVPSERDYDMWKTHRDLTRLVEDLEQSLNEWENRENVPFNQRPFFAPSYTREELDEYKKELDDFDMSFTPPKSVWSHED